MANERESFNLFIPDYSLGSLILPDCMYKDHEIEGAVLGETSP